MSFSIFGNALRTSTCVIKPRWRPFSMMASIALSLITSFFPDVRKPAPKPCLGAGFFLTGLRTFFGRRLADGLGFLAAAGFFSCFFVFFFAMSIDDG